MITTTILGGLGNSLFQIGMLLAHSLKYNLEYCIPNEITYPHSPDQKQFYSKYLNYCAKPNTLPLYLEEGFTYKEIPYIDNVCFQGYWQSYLYIADYREKILNLLNIRYDFKNGWCSIHVRRGDYLLYPTMHPVINSEYLINAIDYIFNITKCENFLVFGDDTEWNKKYFRNIFAYNENNSEKTELNFEFSENKNELEDLSLASSCEHNIGCNSTFSFWIYYLNRNENKTGIFPKKDKWFGKDLPHNVDDLYMPEWTLI